MAKHNLAGNAAATQSQTNSATPRRNNYQIQKRPLPLAHQHELQHWPSDNKVLRGLLPANYNEKSLSVLQRDYRTLTVALNSKN